jgi:hypothetical protein
MTAAGLLTWGALSDEGTGLSFTNAAGLRQRSHSRVRVPWESWPYFTVSDSRLPFSSLPTTRRATVEVFDPASTRDWWSEALTRLVASSYNLSTDRIENIFSNSSSIVTCWFVAAETCLLRRGLATAAFICSTILAFSRHITILINQMISKRPVS